MGRKLHPDISANNISSTWDEKNGKEKDIGWKKQEKENEHTYTH